MKKIVTSKDFPAWFNLTNYDKFSELDITEIEVQLDIRRWMCFGHNMNRKSCMREPLDKNEDFIQIMEGKPLLSAESAQYMSWLPITESDKVAELDHENEDMGHRKNLHEFTMHRSNGAVKPTSISDIISMCSEAQDISHKADIGYNKSSFESVFRYLPISSVLQKHEHNGTKRFFSNELVLTLDLYRSTDKEILDQITNDLQGWRKVMGAAEPKRYKTRADDRAKVCKYNAFAIIDLLLWSAAFEVDIKSSVFMVKVFPDGEYGSKEYSDYIKIFVTKIMQRGFHLV
jgi:hypothetical protein